MHVVHDESMFIQLFQSRDFAGYSTLQEMRVILT